ncbi:KRRI-Interacting protein 1 [Pseudocyphellaria aurata]|nr:KRRI-Interacting protein 1 [Pseudocyphellaria aurata]
MAQEDLLLEEIDVKTRKRKFPLSNDSHQPRKKTKTLLEDDSEGFGSPDGYSKENSADPDNYASKNHILAINQEFAQRFEHNKKREERQQLEEKYGGRVEGSKHEARGEEGDNTASNESSSDSEDEDDEGILASGELDAQIQATLQAIRGKDPRVYDEKAKFYTDTDQEQDAAMSSTPRAKPMYLTDYHRVNLLAGGVDAEIEDENPRTYIQQQDDLRQSVIKEMHHAGVIDTDSSEERKSIINRDSEDDGDNFLVKKLPGTGTANAAHPANESVSKLDPQTAEKDPEAFLSNFMSTRAWIAPPGSKMQPFDSDDEEDERRAEVFEEAYNLRFEDPRGSNEKLLSHARDAAAKYSVRKEEHNSRKKARESERARKLAERRERDEDKARLRKLRIADAEEKIRQIKDAAGLRSGPLEEKAWAKFIDEFWDDHRWEEEMKKQFGDEYYADRDSEDGKGTTTGNGKRSARKPKWQDDIDIQDIVPDFEAEEMQKPPFSLTNDEIVAEMPSAQQPDDMSDGSLRTPPSGTKKTLKKERADQRKDARQQRRRIEEVVDQRLNADDTLTGLGSKHEGRFRYRETSPLAYGLGARDILMASDSQLNKYVGLKKLAAFRDKEKRKKDKRHFGKKARLRQWRKETFGDENGPHNTLNDVVETHVLEPIVPAADNYQGTNAKEFKKKSRSKKKGKSRLVESATPKVIKQAQASVT